MIVNDTFSDLVVDELVLISPIPLQSTVWNLLPKFNCTSTLLLVLVTLSGNPSPLISKKDVLSLVVVVDIPKPPEKLAASILKLPPRLAENDFATDDWISGVEVRSINSSVKW